MSIVTQAGRPSDAELISALADAETGNLTPEAARLIRVRLAGASAVRTANARASGALGGRPKGASAWYAVLEEGADTAWIRDLVPVAESLGLTKGSIGVYLNRGGGQHQTKVERDGREALFTIRYATDTERERLNAAPAESVPMWTPPVAKAKPFSKKPPASKGLA